MQLQDSYQIKVNLDPLTYQLYRKLTPKQKKVLKRVLKSLIVAVATDEDFSGVLEISAKIDFSEEAKKFLKEISGENKYEELAREAVSLLQTLVNMTKLYPFLQCKEFLSSNNTQLKISQLAKKLEE